MDKHYLKRETHDLTGLWLTLAVLAFVVGWRLLVIACSHTPPHWRAIATELGSIPQFKQDLSPNSTGTCLVYCRATEKGVGFYFCETGSGKSRLLCEQEEKGYSWQRYCMLGWSPDNKLFAYAIPLKSHPPNQPWLREEQIVVCDGLTGKTVAKISADPNLYELAWLLPHSFAYSTSVNYDLRVFEQNPDGKWVVRQIFEKVTKNKPETLTAISDRSVAWREGEDIWTFDFATGLIKKIWDSTANQRQLVDFTYSKGTGEFLLNCSDEKGQFLIRFSPDSQEMADAGRIGDGQHSISNVRWVDGGPRYIYRDYLSQVEGWAALCIKTKADGAPIHVPWIGFIENFSLSGDGLFFTGAENGAVPGIWEYDIKSGVSRCIVPSLIGGFVYAKITTPLNGTVTNALGEAKTYLLWPPAQVSVGGKYPLIITREFWNWFPYDQIAANEGFYYANVDESCVVRLCEALAKNPNVDTNRVYLYASSVESSFASKLISEKPDLWKGAILFGPVGGLPDSSNLSGKQLLVIAGKNDGDIFDYLTKYQDRAAETGISLTLSFLDDSGHMPVSIANERVRARQFARFLSEN